MHSGGAEQHSEKQQCAAQEHGCKELVLAGAEPVTQRAEESQEGDAGAANGMKFSATFTPLTPALSQAPLSQGWAGIGNRISLARICGGPR